MPVLHLVPEPAPDPRMVRHDALVADVARRVEAIGKMIAGTSALHLSDQAKQLNALRSQLDLEMTRLEFASDSAWELSGGEC